MSNSSVLSFAILVRQNAYSQQSSLTAYHFTKALLSKKHKVLAVFFYQDGVYNANQLNSPPTDEPNLTPLWQNLATEFALPLHVCTTSALRRGVMDRHSAQQIIDDDNIGHNLAPHFELSGLGYWVKLCLDADRIVTFGVSA